ncbi:MAG: phosphopantetheine-binding protein [bacterium]|nr:phosphopantetheine-binding protein [bacterium]
MAKPWTSDEIETRVKAILEYQLGIDRDDINRESRLAEDLGADSLDLLCIPHELRRIFLIPMSNRSFASENAGTVNLLCEIVASKLGERYAGTEIANT